MDLYLYRQKKNFFIKLSDKKEVICEKAYHFLSDICDDQELLTLLKNNKISLNISSAFVYSFKSSYPIINKKKVITYHKNQLKLLYPNINNIIKLNIKRIHNNYEVCSVFLDHNLTNILKKLHLDNLKVNIVGSKQKYNAYLYLNDYELSLWINDELKYQAVDIEQNSQVFAQNIIKALYYYLYKGNFYVVNNATFSIKINQMILYIKENVEKQVEVIEV